MNNKNKAYLTILLAVLFSLNTTQAAQSLGGNLMGGFGNSMDFGVTPSLGGDTSSQVNADADSSEDDTSSNNDDDASADNAEIKENLNFSKDAKIGFNVQVTGDIKADKNLIIGDNSEVTGNIIVKGDLKVGFNVKIDGYIKVLGKTTIGDNVEVTGNIYGYKTISMGYNSNTSGKLKSAGLFTMGDNYEGEGKLYIFGSKKTGFNTKFNDVKEKGILGKLDAYLQIDISDEDFAAVKKIASTYDGEFAKILAEIKKSKASLGVANGKLKLAKKDSEKETLAGEISALNEKISALKIEGKDLVEKLVVETEQYIENEEFDIKGVSTYLKNEELAKLELSPTAAKEIVNKVVDKVENKMENKTEEKVMDKGEPKNNVMSNSSARDEKMKVAMRGLLEKKLAKFDDAKKNKMYDVLSGKLTTMIEKSNNAKMKNTLTLLKEVIVEMQDEGSLGDSIDNLLNGATDETVPASTGSGSEVKTNIMN